jgi:hypothetical protein
MQEEIKYLSKVAAIALLVRLYHLLVSCGIIGGGLHEVKAQQCSIQSPKT